MQDQTNLTTPQPEWPFAYNGPLDEPQIILLGVWKRFCSNGWSAWHWARPALYCG